MSSQNARGPAARHASRPHRLVVVGDVVLDRDVVGSVERLCPEAPAPVLDLDDTLEGPGAAGLAAVLCLAPDLEVTLVAPLGSDAEGKQLTHLLEAAGVSVAAMDQDGPTRTKTRVLAKGRLLLRIDQGGPARPTGNLGRAARAALEEADAVRVSDYGAGTAAHPELRELLSVLATRGGPTLCWDPHPRGTAPVPHVDLVTPNLVEARQALALSGAPAQPPVERAGADAMADRLRAQWQAAAVAVTAAEQGAWLSSGADGALFVPTTPVDEDSCGAGDQFAASTVRELVRGRLLSEAVAQGVADATAWVASGGAAAHRRRLDQARTWHGPRALAAAPLTAPRPRTLVATGGCFDVLHAGHVATIEAARCLGDRLVVVLNSDASVRRLKGPGRPVHRAEDRAAVLSALAAVDEVVVFDEDDPRAVLDRLRPDIWAKGGDYDADALVESDLVRSWGGRVVLLPYLAGRSTTAVLEGLR